MNSPVLCGVVTAADTAPFPVGGTSLSWDQSQSWAGLTENTKPFLCSNFSRANCTPHELPLQE